jgi:galactokinase
MIHLIRHKHLTFFNKKPLLIVAPGRINLIGEHTDYNEGFVLPASIDKHIVFAISKNNKRKFRFLAYDLEEIFEVTIDDIAPVRQLWANYLLGVIAQLKKRGIDIEGVNCVFGGDIPLGAGLSSSAALETGFAFALNEIFNLGLTKLEIVKLSQIAEHEYAGTHCGIMDQFISVFGERNKVLKLDCRSLDYELYPLNLPDHQIILCDTQVKHTLASSEYNIRRRECETGVNLLKKHYPSILNLRDVSSEMLREHRSEFLPVIYKRCKYVIEENQRLLDACEALTKSNITLLGELMFQTHSGLKDEYEVSCDELDILVDIARKSGIVIGSRMMGGGFGGCTINIVENTNIESFIDYSVQLYADKTDYKLKTYIVSIEDGTHVIT